MSLRVKILLFCVALTAIVGCAEKTNEEQAKMVQEAYTYYWQARKYDDTWQMRLAELYYKKAYETLKDDPSQDWFLYGDAGYRYAYLIEQYGDMEKCLAVVNDLLSKDIRPRERTGLLSLMGECQLQLGEIKEAKETYAKAYKVYVDLLGGECSGDFNMVVMCFGIFDSYMEIGEYVEAEKWLTRMEEEFKAFEKLSNDDKKLIDEYKGHLAVNHARLLQATNHKAEAATVYDAIPSSLIYNPLAIGNAAKYLMAAERYDEASDMYARLDTTFAAIDSTRITFDKISECIAPRYQALRHAGRSDEALAMADNMAAAIDSALNRQKHNDAAELSVIYLTHEKEMALKESKTKIFMYRILSVAALLLLLLIGYIHLRVRRYNRLLTEKNRFLYEQMKKREQAEDKEQERQKSQPTETLSNSQRIYNSLCELMKNSDVYTDADANHETLARLVGTNYKYVYDALRECADTTPADFINQHRIRHAAMLLTTTGDPVGQIAEQCGIPNRSTFNRLFREQYSMSPTEFRKAAAS